MLFVFGDDGEVGFFELNGVDFGWRVHHEVDAGAIFGEGDDVADVVGIF